VFALAAEFNVKTFQSPLFSGNPQIAILEIFDTQLTFPYTPETEKQTLVKKYD
jgi:hypothetical protein